MEGKQFPFYLLLLFSWLIVNQVASDIPTTKKGCDPQCGNVSIPFPFGIKQGCFLDEWFEIVCQNDNSSNTIPKPILNRTKLEVIEISVEGTLQVRNPITFLNCSDKQIHQSANLEGSPFKYSQNNKFAAVGCGAIALMNSGEASIGGCSSICNNTAYGNSCNGINCCQTTIPSNLKSFNTIFLNLPGEGSGNQCKFAFMADQRWLESGSTNISAIQDMVDVPVELNWELYHYSTYDIFGTFVETNSSGSSEYNCSTNIATSEYGCYANSSCDVYIVNANQQRLQCTCGSSWAFEGNPYLLQGCKDIDHCKKDPNYCGEGYICTDYLGGVGCSLPEHKKSPLKAILIGVGSGVLGLLFLSASAWLLTKYIKKRRREKFFKQNGGLFLQQQLSSGEANIEKTKLFKSDELEKVTDQFNTNRVLGQGGQGTVYKGMLTDGKIVAVKKSKKVDGFKVAEFINEVVILSQINHRSVVKLLGCCLETEVPLLVYEFIPNGTLFRYIHDQNEGFELTWETRLRIAQEIAGALSYLHSAASFPIYHRDIKSSNILLDEKYRAKIADFGTSRSVTIEQTHLTTLVYGTFGYLDPEYFQSSQFTDKSDVYSFGVVLAELLTGRKPVFMEAEEGGSLAASFILSMEENRLFDIVDARVLKEATGEKEAIMAVAKLAKRCLDLSGRKRPSMKEVAMELERIQKSVKASDYVEQNVEVVEYDRNEMTAPWDDVSISTWSASYGGIASSSDMEAPLNEKHMVTYK
nr:wall-associated receptor kinase-like 3 [Ziziphus jujuba var. spinosa]